MCAEADPFRRARRGRDAEVTAWPEEEKEAQTDGWADLAVPWIRRLVIVGIGLGVLQQFTGVSSITSYGGDGTRATAQRLGTSRMFFASEPFRRLPRRPPRGYKGVWRLG